LFADFECHLIGRAYVLSSGTVGAALEACIAGTRAIALSFSYTRKHTEEEIEIACKVGAQTVLDTWLNWPEASPAVELVNINVPLGCSLDAKRYMTHCFKSTYGPLFKTEEQSASVDHDVIKNNPDLSACLKHCNGSESDTDAPAPHKHIQIHHQMNLKFGPSFKRDSTLEQQPGFYGSDFWAVFNNHIAVTPFRAMLQDAAAPELIEANLPSAVVSHAVFPRPPPQEQ
jgi:tubulin---tyrosine ligase